MEPNQNIMNQPMQQMNSTPSIQPMPGKTDSKDIVFSNGTKKSKGMIFGMIILAILAIGGIGFGVWAILDGNAQKDSLNLQISSLKQQNSDLLDKLAEFTVDEDEGKKEENTEKEIAISYWPVKAGQMFSSFYVLNDLDEVVAKDSSVSIESLGVCDSPVGEQVVKELTCRVVYGGGKEGVYYYDGETGTLKFYTADEWRTYSSN